MQIQSLSGRHFTMLQSKQRHMEICGRRRLVLLTYWEKCGQPSWSSCYGWRSLLGGLNVISLCFIIFSLSDLAYLGLIHPYSLQWRMFWDSWLNHVKPPDGQNRVATLVGPGHLRKDGKPRQHHLQQPRYSPVQRSLKLQLDMSRKMYLICPVSSNVEDSLKMFETCSLGDSVVLPDVI